MFVCLQVPRGQVQRQVLHEEGHGQARGDEAQEGRPKWDRGHVRHVWKAFEKPGAADNSVARKADQKVAKFSKLF